MNKYDCILYVNLAESTVHYIIVGFTNFIAFLVGLFLVFYALLNILTYIVVCSCHKTTQNRKSELNLVHDFVIIQIHFHFC